VVVALDQPEIALTTSVRMMYRRKIAMIGLKSNIPSGGMNRLKIRR
jgi:hypothetical protein